MSTREQFLARFESTADAVEFETATLSIGRGLRTEPLASANANDARRVSAAVRGAHNVCAKMEGKR